MAPSGPTPRCRGERALQVRVPTARGRGHTVETSIRCFAECLRMRKELGTVLITGLKEGGALSVLTWRSAHRSRQGREQGTRQPPLWSAASATPSDTGPTGTSLSGAPAHGRAPPFPSWLRPPTHRALRTPRPRLPHAAFAPSRLLGAGVLEKPSVPPLLRWALVTTPPPRSVAPSDGNPRGHRASCREVMCGDAAAGWGDGSGGRGDTWGVQCGQAASMLGGALWGTRGYPCREVMTSADRQRLCAEMTHRGHGQPCGEAPCAGLRLCCPQAPPRPPALTTWAQFTGQTGCL